MHFFCKPRAMKIVISFEKNCHLKTLFENEKLKFFWNFLKIFEIFLKMLRIFPDFRLFLTYQVSYHLPDRKLELNALLSVHRYKSTCHGRSSLQIDLSRTIIATNRLVTDDHPYKWTCHGRSSLHCNSFQLLTKLSENLWNREPFSWKKTSWPNSPQ